MHGSRHCVTADDALPRRRGPPRPPAAVPAGRSPRPRRRSLPRFVVVGVCVATLLQPRSLVAAAPAADLPSTDPLLPPPSSLATGGATAPAHEANPVASVEDLRRARRLVADLEHRLTAASAVAAPLARARRTWLRRVAADEWRLLARCAIGRRLLDAPAAALLLAATLLPVPLLRLLLLSGGGDGPQWGTAAAGDTADGAPLEVHAFQHVRRDNDNDNEARRLSRAGRIALRAAGYLQQVARIALAVTAVDLLQMGLVGLARIHAEATTLAGTDGDDGPAVALDAVVAATVTAAPPPRYLSHALAPAAYLAWAAHTGAALARGHLRHRHALAPAAGAWLGRLATALAYGTAALLWVVGTLGGAVRQHGWSSGGPVTTLALAAAVALGLGLPALLDPLRQVANGFLIASSHQVEEGDVIEWQAPHSSSAVRGIVVRLGWTDTWIQTQDDAVVAVPHAQLRKLQVHNLSRGGQSAFVRQVLRFRNRDAARLPALLKGIRDELRLACPRLVTDDPARPLRVHWTGVDGGGDLLVQVEAHLGLSPLAAEYWDERQRLLQAIHRAIRIHQVEFAPAVPPPQTSADGPMRRSLHARSSSYHRHSTATTADAASREP